MWALNKEVAGRHKVEQADRHMKDRILTSVSTSNDAHHTSVHEATSLLN